MSMYDVGFRVCQELRSLSRGFADNYEDVFLYVSSWGGDFFEVTMNSGGGEVHVDCENFVECLEQVRGVYDVSLEKDDMTGFHELPVRVCFTSVGG